MRALSAMLLIPLSIAFLLWAAGYHIVWPPTEDQLYGCSVQNAAPNGECE